MRTFKQFLKGLGYHESINKQHTAFFLISGLCLGLFFVYMALNWKRCSMGNANKHFDGPCDRRWIRMSVYRRLCRTGHSLTRT